VIKNILIMLLAAALAASLYRHQPLELPTVKSPELVPVKPNPEPEPKSPSKFEKLHQWLAESLQEPDFQGAALGFCLLDPQGQVVVDHHAETACIPASSLKTVTTATALEKLGPEFQIVTTLSSTAIAVDGTISGNLVIRGGGDPMLSMADLQSWAADLKNRGIHQIKGDIIGDGRLFEGSIYDDFWNWGDIGNGYGSAVSGLNLEHNRFTATFRAGATLGSATQLLGVHPAMPGVDGINETVTAAEDSGDGVMIHGGERTALLHFRGTVPLGRAQFQVQGAVPDPEAFAAHHFKEALLTEGIEVTGVALPVGQRQVTASHELLKHHSPPLKAIVTSIHATSDNHETECLFRLLGLRENLPPDVVIRQHWQMRGLNFMGLRMVDGCGLARADHIRPVDLARLQFLAARGTQGLVYQDSLLSKAGLRWKGGAMSGVRSTTGYVTSFTGQEYCFAFMVNHYRDGSAVASLRDALIQKIRELQ
jgi:D-alanyl-D-alanine carboxypeptidase/D-alanyl-D-alanine-endopeptidase (penicillin-binding protein 4)